ncbi:hypothetical protein TNCV_160111 [Trichonephila clavipes]|uniref:Uncharacterized protein n=1 Tax=Trichonephila clavipes TaxID=2585209 RepID=A0A8X6RER9_TRICX|nr:hypothetical protein TNCV_160111 [Trichonephila clavipes]
MSKEFGVRYVLVPSVEDLIARISVAAERIYGIPEIVQKNWGWQPISREVQFSSGTLNYSTNVSIFERMEDDKFIMVLIIRRSPELWTIAKFRKNRKEISRNINLQLFCELLDVIAVEILGDCGSSSDFRPSSLDRNDEVGDSPSEASKLAINQIIIR